MPGRRRAVVAGALLGVSIATGLTAAGCADEGAGTGPDQTALPDGLTAFVDQSRVQRQGRTVFVRLINDTGQRVTVTQAVVGSPRFPERTWTGEKSFVNEADLEFELPPGRCGRGSDATVRLTYRLDDGPERVSTTTARDRYGAIGLFLARDCAEATLAEAADVEVGEPSVTGRGRGAVFELPVRFVPTGERADVAFAGFEDTVLFRNAPRSPTAGGEPVPVTGEPVRVVLRLVPARCDPHALAEDKVGTLVGVRVDAPELPPGSSYYLPLGEPDRSALRGFFAVHCGL
ncbi:hypothetical protein [Nocardioides pantholopis]|uniref:hypothetical protein n=1 Tax=Nocardioides pantholopis TaxID=2483798 RepID=UPI000FDB8B8F|nr:hypothetical protein [Nocardioides pantholopis]